jgi:hypothetical protein
MTHQAVDAHVAKAFEVRDEFAYFVETYAEAAHARVDLDVCVSHCARVFGCLVECFKHVEAIHDGSEPVLKARGRLTRPEPAQTEHWLRYAGRPQLNSFFRKRDAKPVDALLGQPASAFDGAVTVRIRLNDRHHSRRPTDEVLDLFEIRGEIIEMYFRPRRASGNVDLLILERHGV